jgi:ABC-2 type transport system permease protein
MIGTLKNEFYKGTLLTWSYRFNMAIMMLMMVVMFAGIVLLFGEGAAEGRFEAKESFLVGWLVSFYAFGILGEMTFSIRDEMSMGTLEQMLMSPSSIGLILVGRVLTNLIINSVVLTVAGGILMLLFEITLPINLAGILVFFLTALGLFGFGFIAAGLTIIFKHVESFTNMLTNLLLFTNGTLVAIEYFPDWFAGVMRLFPTTQGIIVVRQVLLDDQSLADVWADGGLVILTLHSLAFFVVGLMVFEWCEGIAIRKGSLGQY